MCVARFAFLVTFSYENLFSSRHSQAGQSRQGLKPKSSKVSFGTTEVMPCYKPLSIVQSAAWTSTSNFPPKFLRHAVTLLYVYLQIKSLGPPEHPFYNIVSFKLLLWCQSFAATFRRLLRGTWPRQCLMFPAP